MLLHSNRRAWKHLFRLSFVLTLISEPSGHAQRPAGMVNLRGTWRQLSAVVTDCFDQPPADALEACMTLTAVINATTGVPKEEPARVDARLRDVFLDLGRYTEAEAPARRALKAVQSSKGNNSPAASSQMDRLATVLWREWKQEDAEAMFRRALAIKEATLGKNHSSVATTLSNLAVLLKDRGKLAEAESLFRRALAILEGALGRDHPTVATAVSNLAAVLEDRGKPTEALPLLRRALAVKKATFGPDHREVAIILGKLGLSLMNRGNHTEAETLLRRALAIGEASLGQDYPSVLAAVRNLAHGLRTCGKLAEAESLFRRALAMEEATRGPVHPAVAIARGHLAGVLHDRGKVIEAETLLRSELAISETALGPNHPYVATVLGNLGLVLHDRGNVTEAEPLLRRALAIDEAALGPNHPEVATALGNLALVRVHLGPISEVEPLFRRALAIEEFALGPDHPNVATSLGNLSWVLRTGGQLERAEPLLRRALAIREASLGPDHPEVATALSELALALKNRGEFTAAESMLLRALTIDETALGHDHPKLATIHSKLARLSLARGMVSRAIAALHQVVRIRDLEVRTSPTEDYAAGLLADNTGNQMVIYGLALTLQQDKDMTELAMRTALLNKSRTQEVGTLANQALQNGLKTAEQKARYAQMQVRLEQRARLINLARLGGEAREHAKNLLWEAQQIEQELAQEVGVLSSQRMPGVDQILEQVATRLPPDSALVEIVMGSKADYRQPESLSSTREDHYIALVFFPSREVRPVDLGTVQQVHSTVTDWLGELETEPPAPKFVAKAAQAPKRLLDTAQSVYAQVFRPLDNVLKAKGVQRLVVAPDGVLNSIPWGALYDGDRYLVDRYAIQYVNAGRDLLSKRSALATLPAVVLAAADAPGQRLLQQARLAAPVLARELHGKLLAGQTATEHNLRQSENPYALTLISHGVFQDGSFVTQEPSARHQKFHSVGRHLSFESLVDNTPMTRLADQWDVEDAMHGSALALMPGQNAETDSQQDGWLTGEEARRLNLHGTQLVTVLACQSGKGGLSAGQGVYGLRRAFLQAGAETVVSTLWSVDEASATELVKKFTHRLLSEPGKGRVAALEEAMKELREQDHGKYSHPFYWAPFVLMGMDGPLRPPALRDGRQ